MKFKFYKMPYKSLVTNLRSNNNLSWIKHHPTNLDSKDNK